MLSLKKITKVYKTANSDVTALKGISIDFRNSEFVSILGQSGCGKTTLLNIIGGLDRYTSGNLIINGKSTKDFNDRDWDSYRNYSVGFVFQSYNLIPHQSVLANVELALTISGYSKVEKRKKAEDALKSVGLKEHIHKKPSQLSGGQMQRVAIARAIVNDPDIILADEPTGALDSKTSTQIMELLKKISKDKLIIMVTHNSEIAEKYSNRIIKLVDGKVIDDSNPYKEDKTDFEEIKGKKKRTKMKFITAMHLSLNNLMTKKWRTILTSFAGSIGIIGIALILSLSTGLDKYIDNIQKDTMISYPITIESETFDLGSIIETSRDQANTEVNEESIHESDAIYSNDTSLKQASSLQNSLTKNNLTEFKKYLDNKDSDINNYLGENGVVYSYDTKFDVYTYDKDNTLINTDGSDFEDSDDKIDGITLANRMEQNSTPSTSFSFNQDSKSNFERLMPGTNTLYNDSILNEYEVVSRKYAK